MMRRHANSAGGNRRTHRVPPGVAGEAPARHAVAGNGSWGVTVARAVEEGAAESASAGPGEERHDSVGRVPVVGEGAHS